MVVKSLSYILLLMVPDEVRLALLFIAVCFLFFGLFRLSFGFFYGFLRKCQPCCFFVIVRMEISLLL